MSWPRFLKEFGLFSVVMVAIGIVSGRMSLKTDIFWLYTVSLIVFSLFCLVIFYYARISFSTSSAYSANRIVIISFLSKLLLSVGILLLFERIFSPRGNGHILHYLFIYIFYTVFEVYFLMKLSKNSLS